MSFIVSNEAAPEASSPLPPKQPAQPLSPQTGGTEQPFWYATIHEPVAAFTLALVLSTVLLWRATLRLAKDARENSIAQGQQMERSIAAATKAAEAAVDQTKIAQDTAYLELRAYISIDAKVTVWDDIIKGQISISNTGQTPARVEVFAASRIGPIVGVAPPAMPQPILDKQMSPYVNARSEETLVWFHPFPPFGSAQEIAEWVANPEGKVFYCYGRIEFTDFLKQKVRILNFCFRTRTIPVIGEPIEMVPTTWGNEYEKRDI